LPRIKRLAASEKSRLRSAWQATAGFSDAALAQSPRRALSPVEGHVAPNANMFRRGPQQHCPLSPLSAHPDMAYVEARHATRRSMFVFVLQRGQPLAR